MPGVGVVGIEDLDKVGGRPGVGYYCLVRVGGRDDAAQDHDRRRRDGDRYVFLARESSDGLEVGVPQSAAICRIGGTAFQYWPWGSRWVWSGACQSHR